MKILVDYLFFIPLVFIISLVYNSLKREAILDIFKSAARTTAYLFLGVTAFSIVLYFFMELVLS